MPLRDGWRAGLAVGARRPQAGCECTGKCGSCAATEVASHPQKRGAPGKFHLSAAAPGAGAARGGGGGGHRSALCLSQASVPGCR